MKEVYFDTANTGDQMSRPSLYFDLSWFNGTLFGGGVLRARETGPKPWIAWGVGSTNRESKSPKPRPAGFDLFGSRDYRQADADAWVPCASCMSPLFDECRKARPGFVVTFFWNARKPGVDLGLPTMDNEQPLDEIIRHLSLGELVVTNSYHGAYWATLLGRKAIIYQPYSSKFWNYKHQPVILEEGDWRKADPIAYPEALEECRAANVAFYEMAKERFA